MITPVMMGRGVRRQLASVRVIARWVAYTAITCGTPGLMIGCTTDPDCPLAVPNPGIEVEVRDGATGEPAAYGALGLAIDGAYVDTLDLVTSGLADSTAALVLRGAWGNPGQYDVQVSQQGFQVWTTSGVTVEYASGRCAMVVTVTLRADLEPAP